MKHKHEPAHDHHGRHHGDAAHVHDEAPRARLALCVALTGGMMLIEFAGGLLTNSLALISDAGHMLTHFIALGISYLAARLAALPPTERRSYGYFRAEILAAFTNGILLVGVTIYIVYEAVMRLLHPQPVEVPQMMGVAVAGLAVNVFTAALLSRAGKRDLNVRSAFLHMLGDTLSSVAIVAGGAVMLFTGWLIVDPLLSGLICALILYWAYRLLRESAAILLESAPRGVAAAEVAACLKEIDGVGDVHDLHLWEITSRMNAMTAHVTVGDMSVSRTERILHEAAHRLRERFQIGHVVLQFETGCCRVFGRGEAKRDCCGREEDVNAK